MSYTIYSYQEMIAKFPHLAEAFADTLLFDGDELLPAYRRPALNDFFAVVDGDLNDSHLHLTAPEEGLVKNPKKLKRLQIRNKDTNAIFDNFLRNEYGEACDLKHKPTRADILAQEPVEFLTWHARFNTPADNMIQTSAEARLESCRGVVVLGDVVLSDYLFLDNITDLTPAPPIAVFPQSLYVCGNLSVPRIVLKNAGEIVVKGNISCEQLVNDGSYRWTNIQAEYLSAQRAFWRYSRWHIGRSQIERFFVTKDSFDSEYGQIRQNNQGKFINATNRREPAFGIATYPDMPENMYDIRDRSTEQFKKFAQHLIFAEKFYDTEDEHYEQSYRFYIDKMLEAACHENVFSDYGM